MGVAAVPILQHAKPTDAQIYADAASRVIALYQHRVHSQAPDAYEAGQFRKADAAEQRFNFFGLQWRAFARINNLFDEDIIGSVRVNAFGGRYYEPAPGRNWMLGLWVSKSFD
ncbi:MAG: TonB-dependent receptor [Nitrococcus sp.]|nr:TonB-dependent receptor [Nitrococcus sp.]